MKCCTGTAVAPRALLDLNISTDMCVRGLWSAASVSAVLECAVLECAERAPSLAQMH